MSDLGQDFETLREALTDDPGPSKLHQELHVTALDVLNRIQARLEVAETALRDASNVEQMVDELEAGLHGFVRHQPGESVRQRWERLMAELVDEWDG